MSFGPFFTSIFKLIAPDYHDNWDHATYIGTLFALLQTIFSPMFIIIGGILLVTSFDIYSSTHWFRISAIFIPVLLILGVCGLVKFAIKKWDEKFETEEMNRCERDLKIGFGGIVLCGYIAQSFFVSGDPKASFTPWCALTICHLSSFTFLFLFVSPSSRKVNDKENEKFSAVSITCEFIILFLSILIYGNYRTDNALTDSKVLEAELGKFIFRLLITTLYTTNTRDFLLVFKGEVRKYALEEEQKRLKLAQAPKKVVPRVKQQVIQIQGLSARPKSSECQICLLEYSEIQIPRMLRQCGHTVCQQCVEKLLKQNNQIPCPFCREVTVVDGSATSLPKNYTVLEMILERKIAGIV